MAPRRAQPGDPPTDRQRELVGWIAAFYVAHGYPPSVREIAAGLGIGTPNGVTSQLHYIHKKGLIHWPRNKGRSGARARAIVPAGYCVVEAAELERLRKAAGESGA